MEYSVQSLSRVQLFATPWTAACQASLSFTNSQSLLKCMSIESVKPSNYRILWYPLLCLQSFPALGCLLMSKFFISNGQSIGVSASASVFPMNIQDWFQFRMDWLDLLAVQGTLRSLLQHHNTKASILQCSAFSIVQLSNLSHPYKTTGETITLTRQIFVGKMMSLLFKMLSRLVITFFQGASIF